MHTPRGLSFIFLIIAFSLGVIVHSSALPLFEGSDEDLHYAYVERIRATGALPDRATALTNATKQVSGHAPLTYLVGVVFAEALNLPRLDDPAALYERMGVARNPWNTPGNDWNRVDNHNFYYPVAPADPDLVWALHTLRLLSLGWGVLGIVGAYGAAREVFRVRRWALTATALFAFMPTYVHSAAYLNNDISATALATLTLWCVLRLLRRGASTRRLLILGALVALAGLAKINALAVAPAALAALVLAWRRRGGWLRLARQIALFGLPIVLLFLPWVIWGALTYGDPLGTNTHNRPGFFYDPPLTLTQLPAQLPNAFVSYWARFGLSVTLSPAIYLLFALLTLAAIAGCAIAPKGWLRGRGDRALVLAVVIAFAGAGLLRWMSLYPAIPARLALPAHGAFAIGVAGGLRLLSLRMPRLDIPVRVFALGVVMCSGLVAGTLAVDAAYTSPPAARSPDPVERANTIDFDGSIRLLSAQLDTKHLTSDWLPVTLCWEVLRVPEREPAYTVKLIDQAGILADRTTLFGLGLRPRMRWQVGDRWCETVELPVSGRDLPPAHAYNVVLALLDARTYASDWPAMNAAGDDIDPLVLGRAYSPAGDMRTSADDFTETSIVFPGLVALRGYALEGEIVPGGTVALRLLWEVTGTTPDDWTQFIHMSGDGMALSLADGTPRAGEYPTDAWSAGERIADAWSLRLPDDLPPGHYRIELGFYQRETGVRMPVSHEGTVVDSGAALLLTFDLE